MEEVSKTHGMRELFISVNHLHKNNLNDSNIKNDKCTFYSILVSLSPGKGE